MRVTESPAVRKKYICKKQLESNLLIGMMPSSPKSEVPFLQSASFREEAVIEAFKKTHTDLANNHIDFAFSGTTSVIVFLAGSFLLCANVGDSRAVLGSQTLSAAGELHWISTDLSRDHKPGITEEYKRIIKTGGRVDNFRGRIDIIKKEYRA